MNKALETPALHGDVVTEAHAQMCREHGHMTHTVDGVTQHVCPRCGESTVEQSAPQATTQSLFETRVEHYRARGEDYATAYTWASDDVRRITRTDA